MRDIEERKNLNCYGKPDFVGDFFTMLDEVYSDKLKKTLFPPIVMYYKGNIDLLKSRNVIAISGTRDLSAGGAYDMSEILGNLESTILIDGNDIPNSVATNAFCAIKHNKIICVLPHGIDVNNELAENVVDRGGLVLSEYPTDTPKSTSSCIGRLRIIAGIADKLLIVESTKNSGSLMLVEHMLRLEKQVFVVPKSIADTKANDYINNTLIYEGATPCYETEQLYDIGQENN